MKIEIDLSDLDYPTIALDCDDPEPEDDDDIIVGGPIRLDADQFHAALTQLLERAPERLGLFAWVQSYPGARPALYMERSSGEQLAQITALALRLAGEMMSGGTPPPEPVKQLELAVDGVAP